MVGVSMLNMLQEEFKNYIRFEADLKPDVTRYVDKIKGFQELGYSDTGFEMVEDFVRCKIYYPDIQALYNSYKQFKDG